MLNVYLDDFDLIRVESNRENEKFLIWNKETVVELSKLREYKMDMTTVYEFKPHFPIDLSKEYFVYNQFGEKAILKSRNIVRTKRFDEEFYYEGPLGCEYTQKETTFRVWAPTSSDMLLKLMNPTRTTKHTFRMERMSCGVYSVTVQGDFDGWSYMYIVKNQGEWKETVDPYALASKVNSTESYVIDKKKVRLVDEVFPIDELPMIDAIIYETHVRDFSIHKDFPFRHKGKFLAYMEEGLQSKDGKKIGIDYIKELGVTHLQFLPVFDFSSVTEFDFDESYNWGYDPEQYNVVEGRYSTYPDDPYCRIIELKQTLAYLRANNIGSIMDVVYNHVFKRDTFSFEKLVPGYFYRFDDENNYIDGTGCGNDIASERKMVRKFIIDSLVYWMTEFKFNGFRFDLMGILDIQTMNEILETLRKINPNVYIYGEGWNMPTGLLESDRTTQENAYLTPEIGFFNSFFRDIVKGSTFNVYERGLAMGNLHFLGAVHDVFTASIHTCYGSPKQSINYVSCHDNHTLYDRMRIACSEGEVRPFQKLALAMTVLSQGVPFLHAGCEFSRTKQLHENSYNLPDEINYLDWSLLSSEEELWFFVRDLIHIRKMHKAFRLDTKEDILNHVVVNHDGHMIHYHMNHVQYLGGYDFYMVIFNITNYEHELPLEGMWEILTAGEEIQRCEDILKVQPYEVKILAKNR